MVKEEAAMTVERRQKKAGQPLSFRCGLQWVLAFSAGASVGARAAGERWLSGERRSVRFSMVLD